MMDEITVAVIRMPAKAIACFVFPPFNSLFTWNIATIRNTIKPMNGNGALSTSIWYGYINIGTIKKMQKTKQIRTAISTAKSLSIISTLFMAFKAFLLMKFGNSRQAHTSKKLDSGFIVNIFCE